MIEARPWLPDSCLTSKRAVAPFRDVFADWSAHWFVSPPFKASDQWKRRKKGLSHDTARLGLVKAVVPGLALQCRPEADLAVANALLTLPASQSPQNAHDQQLLRVAGATILSDLKHRLTGLLGKSHVPGGPLVTEEQDDLFEMWLNDSVGNPVVHFFASSELLMEIIRGGIRTQRPLPDPIARAEAISAHQVEYAARIGFARLPHSDLADLAAGDVLVLETRREAAAFDLTIEGQVAFTNAVVPTVIGAIHP
ncbi:MULTISPECIES: hypothetical protein [unclassified Sphingopyxis]|uniref:hypothetical protein n=1 Tax=unclassified Sphingopyxis TaxID=2614943 RepID=UPI000AB015FF|nr:MULTISPECIES: hypothetical protein [unclassified Sphingopyxis]